MIHVLIVDDDAAERAKTLRCLARPDVQLSSAADGQMGLEKARQTRPDMVICDVDMPGMNGFEVLEALRADPALASVQVMMLTAKGSRDAVRLGMTLGADDYLTKPFTEEELVSAFDSLLKKRVRIEDAIDSAVKGQEDQMRRVFGQRLGGEPPATLPEVAGTLPSGKDATVLFSDIRGFTSIAEKLTSPEVAALLTEYFERVCEPVLQHGGHHLKMLGDGLMAVFMDAPPAAPAARRALDAALSMAREAGRFATWVQESFPGRGLPAFRIGVGVHRGEVSISYLGSAADKMPTPIGDTVNTAARLESASKELGWTIVASNAVVQGAGPGVRVGATASLNVRGKTLVVDVSEVLGMAVVQDGAAPSALGAGYEATLPQGEQGAAGRDTPAGAVTARWRADAAETAHMAARAVKSALDDKLASFALHGFGDGEPALRLGGYRIVRRVGHGGMSSIYLARSESTGELLVLKILNADREASDAMARFAREYALLSSIDHPHIIRIFNQGFSDRRAYIAMEYFENGDLRARMGPPLGARAVAGIGAQIASALSAIHALGIVHRDLKPENLMVRADGSVVLADFGIAKTMSDANRPELSLTLHGDLLGSPSYMSPEQAGGNPVTTKSDLYSLGVILFEMLTGRRPYQGATALDILSQHGKAPVPTLPIALSMFQPLIDTLMAKNPDARPASAQVVQQALSRLAQHLPP